MVTYNSNTWTTTLGSPFYIGFGRELDRLSAIANKASTQAYPPYNLIKIDEDNYQLSLAVAGFSKDDISITIEDSSLIIKGDLEKESDDVTYVHKGIGTRKFTRSFALGEYMEVVGAEFENGLLHIDVERVVPEEKKPKQISIK